MSTLPGTVALQVLHSSMCGHAIGACCYGSLSRAFVMILTQLRSVVWSIIWMVDEMMMQYGVSMWTVSSDVSTRVLGFFQLLFLRQLYHQVVCC